MSVKQMTRIHIVLKYNILDLTQLPVLRFLLLNYTSFANACFLYHLVQFLSMLFSNHYFPFDLSLSLVAPLAKAHTISGGFQFLLLHATSKLEVRLTYHMPFNFSMSSMTFLSLSCLYYMIRL